MDFVKKILIIGGTGFIGPAVVDLLVRSNYEVTLLNRGTRKFGHTRHLQADRNRLTDLQKASNVGKPQYDAIIDLCCYNAEQSRLAWSAFSFRTKKWIYLSSAAVYKNETGNPPKESDEVGGIRLWGQYGTNKYEAEQFLISHAQTAQSPQVTIFRPPYIYGPKNDIDRETFVWVRALNGLPVFIPGHGQTRIQFLHVSDLAGAIKLSLETTPHTASPAIYNVAADECPTLSEWVSLLAEVAGVQDPGIIAGEFAKDFLSRQYFPFRDCPCWVDNSQIKKDLHWLPYYSIKEGFFQTYRSYPDESLKHFPLDHRIRKNEDELARKHLSRSGRER